jgi:dipeptidyl aminopeptidase/acylaminoacyl peptidase
MVKARPSRAAAHRFVAVLVMLAALISASPALASCSDLVPIVERSVAARAVTPKDLLGLRDIGYPDPLISGGPSPFAVSPSGQRVAFVLTRADPVSNGYCRALVVLPIRAGAAPRIIDRGGELITITDVQRGMFVRGGFPAIVTPAWSPDGRWIAYLRRDDGVTQVWRARSDGGGAQAVTRLKTDAESVRWTSDGRSLIYESRPAKEAIAEAIDREGQSGWLYDERVVTFSGPRPQIRAADAPLVSFRLDLATGKAVRISPQPASNAGDAAMNGYGQRAWIAHSGISSGTGEIKVARADGREIACPAASCHGDITGLWWDRAGDELRYLRRQGWDGEQTALYRWRPGHGDPQLSFTTLDALTGCTAAFDQLVCGRQNATTPKRVVAIDPTTGASMLLFDPNPGFARLRFGHVERLRWRNDRGLETWGDLVLPPGYKGDRKLPLIIVQYSSRGFLRGGTGDEYPIFPLAAHGFAVLSLERPPFVASLVPGVTDALQFAAINERNWADRRSLLSAIEVGVGLLIKRGIVDPHRIGITGLSDGATTARFALINSNLFAAASISSCCIEPWTVNTYVGIAFAEQVQSIGFPSLIHPDPAFWKDMSLAQNAARMNVPLLMQLNDDDGYIMALEAFESLREYGKPVEMYVFPHEYHIKWQPVHRLAIYQRNIEWFDFWLRGIEDPDPAKAAQYARWRRMRDRQATSAPPTLSRPTPGTTAPHRKES